MPKKIDPAGPGNGKAFLIRSQVAKEAGVGLEALRFYERKKILPKPQRSESGYRLYDQHHVQRLKFIKKAQVIGFTLEEIKGLLDLVENPRIKCETVKHLAEQKIDEVEKKILDLQRLKTALVDLASRCDNRKDIRHCPIIESLS